MRQRRIVLLTVLFGTLALEASGQVHPPSEVVRRFYANEMRASQTFGSRSLQARKKWLSARLYELFRAELRKQKVHLASYPDEKPFFGDGFPFRPLDEPCTAGKRSYARLYKVQKTLKTDISRVAVPVRFSYPAPCSPGAITYRLRLVKGRGTWLIDELVYEDESTLSDSMRNNHY